MDQSYSESDVSLSPSRIMERLQVLRQLQLFQRGKLQKQRLEYEETSEGTSTITEVVSQFSNSTSYNTFRSLLQSSCETSNDVTPRTTSHKKSPVIKECDLVDGVAAINLSQESEFIVNSPLSSKASAQSRSRNISPLTLGSAVPQNKKQIALDEMPILSPKRDFEQLLLEKLKSDKVSIPKKDNVKVSTKKPFLRRGEGLARFGVKKTDLIIQNTKALPWRRQNLETRVNHTPKKLKTNNNDNIEIITKTKPKKITNPEINSTKPVHNVEKLISPEELADQAQNKEATTSPILQKVSEIVPKIQIRKNPSPLKKINRGATWASVLTKEQDDLLRELKQSDYYKSFESSPAKSIYSDISCDEHHSNIRQQREIAEQDLFEIIEKVTNDTRFENAFFNRIFKQNMECSGESTPLVLQKCLANNPNLLHIFPGVKKLKNQSLGECTCDYTDCSDTGSISSCSTCKSVDNNNAPTDELSFKKNKKKVLKQKDTVEPKSQESESKNQNSQDDTVNENEAMKANMADMNAKLVATSELLKDRLKELEDEIETFRKENNNLTKMREEIDLERQKFYEEKSTFEQKFNEEKILSEYYLAEEREKLTKQKQLYERYVREMRGRLNKKDKDEVITLRKEISDLKEDIRVKDAKSTSTIARLRNQLKLVEKEKLNLQEEIEKLKKENRRIQHSNEITRRLTNVKYLEQINKKLTNMSKAPQSEISLDKDLKYKAFEIERQSRSRKIQSSSKNMPRPRAKSVPNLNVTSRYAKYFSQKDCASHTEGGGDSLILDTQKDFLDDDEIEDKLQLDDQNSIDDNSGTYDDDNYLEKIYMERFQNTSPVNNRACLPDGIDNHRHLESSDQFFLRKSNERESKSPNNDQSYQNHLKNTVNRTKSPVSILSNRSSGRKSPAVENYLKNYSGEADHSNNRSKSPISILSNRSSGSQRLSTVINQDLDRNKLAMLSPEPATSKVSLSKTNLNPTEIKKPDGTRELRFPNGNVKYISADEKYTKFVYYNGDVKENFYSEGRIKYYYAEAKTYHTTHADGLEVLEFPDGQVEKRYKDGSTEIRLPNGSVRYNDPKNALVREEWRFPDGTSLTVSASGEQRILFSNGQVEVHAEDHKRREYPDGTVKLIYNDGTSETRYASGRVRIKDKHGNLIMDSAPG